MNRFKKILLSLGVVAVLLALFFSWMYFAGNVKEGIKGYVYIKPGESFQKVVDELNQKNVLKNNFTFNLAASFVGLPSHLRPGKYLVEEGDNNFTIIKRLFMGRQTPVQLVINSVRTKQQLADKIAESLDISSADFIKASMDNQFLEEFGFDSLTVQALFVPNTYEFYWNTSVQELFARMHKEYLKFWNDERKASAESLGITPLQAVIIASIVEQESQKSDERPIIAGVYMNRLKKGMKLEADPTLVYALGDFNIRRVLGIHKSIDSPYNTYMYGGLPPGPICFPSIDAVDAVLHAAQHDYIFFCAKPDFSGYHMFASNYAQHLANARIYQRTLTQNNILN